MPNNSIKCGGRHLSSPSSWLVENSSGPLKISLSFNEIDSLTLTHNGVPVASTNFSPAGQTATPGTLMPDGTVFAGISPDTDNVFYVAAQDEPAPMMWSKAMACAKTKRSHGHTDWRLPTRGELNVLFNNRAVIGGFNQSDSAPTGWYWSCANDPHLLFKSHCQRFSDGCLGQDEASWYDQKSVRFVRG